MWCWPAPVCSDFVTLASLAVYLVWTVLLFNFIRWVSENSAHAQFPAAHFHKLFLFLQCSGFAIHKHSRYFTQSNTNDVWSSFHLKTTVSFLQTEQQKKKPVSKQEKRPLFTAEEYAMMHLFTLFISDYSSKKIQRKWSNDRAMAQRLVAGLSTRRPGFDPGSVNVGFVMDKVALGQAFPRVLRFSPVNFIPSVLHYNRKAEKTSSTSSQGCTISLQVCGASVASAYGALQWYKKSEPKLVVANFFHPSSWMITFDE
jgi:hypothetical protein